MTAEKQEDREQAREKINTIAHHRRAFPDRGAAAVLTSTREAPGAYLPWECWRRSLCCGRSAAVGWMAADARAAVALQSSHLLTTADVGHRH